MLPDRTHSTEHKKPGSLDGRELVPVAGAVGRVFDANPGQGEIEQPGELPGVGGEFVVAQPWLALN